jgi:hypothetical protein
MNAAGWTYHPAAMRRHPLLLSLITLGLTVSGCDKLLDQLKPKKDTAEAEEDSKGGKGAKGSSSSSAAPEAKKSEPPDPNDAFFTTGGSKSNNLWRVRGGKVTKISLGKCSNVDAIVVDKTGRAWVECWDGVLRVDGEEAVPIDAPVKRAKIELGRDGSFWLREAKPATLYKLEGDTWKKQTVPDGLDVTWNLAVDNKGRPWVSTKSAVYVREGEAWQPAPLGKEKPEDSYPAKLVATDEGTVYVLTDAMRFVGIEDGKVGTRTYANYQEPVARPGGGVIIADSGMGAGSIQIIDAKGKQERSVIPGQKAFFSAYGSHNERLAADTRGRVWIGTKYGLLIIDADGSVQQWEPGRVEGLVGYAVDHVAVGGQGPELPKLGAQIRGEVKGKVSGIDKPTKVELCPGSAGFQQGAQRSFYGPTPCSGTPGVRSATTDKEGNFVFKDVPPYAMSLLIQTNPTSWVDRDPKCCIELKSGETKDVGSYNP